MIIHVVSYISYASSLINTCCDDESMPFMTFYEDHYILREIMLRRMKDL
jgi:hypothetical protein